MMRFRGWWVVFVAAVMSAAAAAAQDLPRGQVLETVATLGDATQSYALYLPSAYTADRTWPILIGFHPGARGPAIVDAYREAAERYGFIVAGSNNSRNGPWDASMHAATSMLRDIGQRLAVDGRRIYLTGHSGGSRVALQLALANEQIAGVIASSAGFADARPRTSVRFAIFATAGTEDFNYLEMRILAGALKTPHRLAIFTGGHTLPPLDVARQAIEWLELQAMASGRRAKDEALIGRIWEAQDRAVADTGETALTVHRLRAMADDFRPLREVAPLEARAAALVKRKDIKRVLDRERDDEQKEMRLLDEFARLQADLAADGQRMQALRDLKVLLGELDGQAKAADDSPERARARRVLRMVTLSAAERSADPQYLELLRQYRPAGPGRGW